MTKRRIESKQAGKNLTPKPWAVSRRQTGAVALATALRPIVDLCLELGVTSPEMERILRGVFVQQAERLLAAGRGGERSANDLRIGLLTGVHRNFVRQIRSTKPRARLQKVQQRHRADALLQAWATDWQYMTPAGSPRELPIEAPEGEPSFTALLARYMPGVSAKTVIALLRRYGAVQLLPDEQIRLRSRSARPAGITEASIATASTQLGQLTSTLLHNLKVPDEPLFCESIEPAPVDPKRLVLVRQTIAKRAQNFLDGLAEELASEASTRPGDQAVAIGLTVFCHTQNPDHDSGAPLKRQRGRKK